MTNKHPKPWHHEQDSTNPLCTWCGGSARGDTWGGHAPITCPNCKVKPVAHLFRPIVEFVK